MMPMANTGQEIPGGGDRTFFANTLGAATIYE